ncbi:hypothetical protein S7S_05130 [Isoalcanivorax pacificus W11-5]|uniref:DUF11 domain-containing protein n=1 Tax=Isoalcanivorax pacificus W11-5 TaxID=391936 RepID=A0A0B4XK62_9GAMM|nr:DUF11 domain-containing protein [Isoalcanivorax pacificus]AJD47446.1 hypothetical protein S7S_05130 [Isoalcanivorax pacificus W11-5]
MRAFISGLLLCAALIASPVWAEGPLSSEIQSYLIERGQNGEEQRVPTTQAAPGDVIEYQLVYRNTSTQPLSGLVVTGPIPANTQYVEASAQTAVDAGFVVSADDGSHFGAEPLIDTTRRSAGEEQAVIPAEAYTHVRWTPNTAIQPGQVQTYSYRVRVL